MREFLWKAGAGALIAGASLSLAGCGDGAEPAENVMGANALEAETMYEPGNDISAMEAATNDVEAESPPVVGPGTNTIAPTDSEILGETSGGDTGGNVAGDDVSGM